MNTRAKEFQQEKKIYAWFLAARPKTFIIALIPACIASALSFAEQGQLNWVISLCSFLIILLFQIGTNLINDALDFKKGADTAKRLGPLRVTQAGILSFREVHKGGLICFALGALVAAPFVLEGGLPYLTIVIGSILCGYLYTGGPFPLAYHGLGELFVFLFYGLVAILGIFYLQTETLTPSAFVAACQSGFLAIIPIAINNLRDIEGDSNANKRTLAVRFGKTFGRCEVTFFLFAPFLMTTLWFYSHPMAAILPWLSLPLAIRICRNIWSQEPSAAYNAFFGQAALLLILFGIMLSVGLYLS